MSKPLPSDASWGSVLVLVLGTAVAFPVCAIIAVPLWCYDRLHEAITGTPTDPDDGYHATKGYRRTTRAAADSGR